MTTTTEYKLLPYQEEGVIFLRSNVRCILADQPGLGKSAMALMALGNKGLIICPKTLKLNWAKEAKRWRPDLKVTVLKTKLAGLKVPEDGELVITNSDILPEELYIDKRNSKSAVMKFRHKAYVEELEKTMRYVTVIIDEAHKFSSVTSSRSCKLNWISSIAGRVWLLTGTPMRKGDRMKLFNLLCVTGLMNIIFGTQRNYLRLANMKYNAFFTRYEPNGPPLPEFHTTLKKYMLRRYLSEVQSELPTFTVESVPCEIEDKEILKYLNEASKKIDYKSYRLPAFEEFSTVRAVLAKSKLPTVLDIIEQYEYNEIPLIVFSAHVFPLQEIAKREDCAIITGDTSTAKRNEIVENQSKYKVLCLSLNCADVGLTLTHFSNILFIDLSWDSTINDQAISRCVRIGQTKHTNVKMLVAEHVIEHHVHKLLSKSNTNIAIMIDGKT